MPGVTVVGSRAGGDGHTIEYRILGPLEIWHDGLAVPTGGPKRRALLGLLLLNANRAVPVDVLLDELWGPDLPRTARASLQNHVSALRRALGSDAIETTDGGYRIVVGDDALDLARFERLIVDARGLEPEARAETLRAALGVWRGLPLVDAPATPAAQAALVRLEELRLEALEDRIEADLATGRHDRVVAELEALVLLHPFRERMWELLMVALHAGGRQADALGAYRRMHRLLTSELGIEPGDRLKALQRRILVGDPAPDRPRADDDALLRAMLMLPVDRPQRVRALVDYGEALRRVGEVDRSDVVLAEARRLAWEEGDEAMRRRIALTLSLVGAQSATVRLHDALDDARRAVAVFERTGDDSARAAALRAEGQMLRDLGRCGEAADTLRLSVAAAVEAGDRWQEGMSRNFLATALLYGPTPVATAIPVCEQELAALEWGPPGPIGLWGSLGWLVAMDGDPVAGRRLAMRAVDGTRAASTPGTYCWAMSVVAGIDELTGDRSRATEGHRAIVDVLDSLGARGALAFHAAELGRLIADAAPDEVEQLALRGKAAAEDDVSSHIAWRRALARVRPGAEGVALATEAVALAERTDFLDLQGHALEDLAALQPPRAASATLERAARAFEEKGNRPALQRVRRGLTTGGADGGDAPSQPGRTTESR